MVLVSLTLAWGCGFQEEDFQKTVKSGTQPDLSKVLPPSPTVAAELERCFYERVRKLGMGRGPLRGRL